MPAQEKTVTLRVTKCYRTSVTDYIPLFLGYQQM